MDEIKEKENVQDTESKKDPELLKFLDLIDSVEPKLTNLQKMDLLIKWKRAYRGLRGIRLTVDPFTKASNEDIAHDFLIMERCTAEGKYEDVTNVDF